MRHREGHRTERIGWLRAAVLGANDGIVSTASLVVGVAVGGAVRHDLVLAGIASVVAGALSMAAGEYVSVSSQADTERADLALERKELATDPTADMWLLPFFCLALDYGRTVKQLMRRAGRSSAIRLSGSDR